MFIVFTTYTVNFWITYLVYIQQYNTIICVLLTTFKCVFSNWNWSLLLWISGELEIWPFSKVCVSHMNNVAGDSHSDVFTTVTNPLQDSGEGLCTRQRQDAMLLLWRSGDFLSLTTDRPLSPQTNLTFFSVTFLCVIMFVCRIPPPFDLPVLSKMYKL